MLDARQLANPVALPWTLAAPAVLLAVMVGGIGGVYPALRAARMDPMLGATAAPTAGRIMVDGSMSIP